MVSLPKQASIVIIGGGVIGCSIAYHLAKRGCRDVVLLERRQLTCGTTWHAAGLIGQLRATRSLTQLARYSAQLYDGLEAETGIAIGYKRHGSLAIALSDDRLEEWRRSVSRARLCDVEAHLLDPAGCGAHYPLLDISAVRGGVFFPDDGQADPVNITRALAAGARSGGVSIFENCAVTAIHSDQGGQNCRHVRGVDVDVGGGEMVSMASDIVINCAGLWGHAIGQMAGVTVPLQACEHYYVLTTPIPDLPADLPVLRAVDDCAYVKSDAGKLLIGAFEPEARPWAVSSIPEDFCFDSLAGDFDHFAPILTDVAKRLPILNEIGLQTFFCGPESFTPDNRYLLGETAELDGFFLACGFNSIGIQSAGGVGLALANWVIDGDPGFDLHDVDCRRMASWQNNRRYITARVKESLGLLYADHYPDRQYQSARDMRHSPLHDRLAEGGACFGENAGWERPHWFEPEAMAPPRYRSGWGRMAWFDHVAAECHAVRSAVGLFDMSPLVKFLVQGEDAASVLQYLCANDIDVAPGRIIYTPWLNEKGGVEADLTVTRLAADRFLIVTSASASSRDWSWFERRKPASAHCTITDITAAEAVLSITGPQSRDLLQSLSPDDFSATGFAFGTARAVSVGMATVRAHRLSYAGELGWELYVASDQARRLYDDLISAGSAFGLRLCGVKAMDSCRVEKGFRHYGHDITEQDGVLEAGLGFAIKCDKKASSFGDFIGRDAVIAARHDGLKRMLVQFRLCDAEPLLHGGETIHYGSGGYLTSAAYGHEVGAALGMGYLALGEGEAPPISPISCELEIAARCYPAIMQVQPFYDPDGRRLRS